MDADQTVAVILFGVSALVMLGIAGAIVGAGVLSLLAWLRRGER